jgi:hypothetical protein
MTIAIDSVLKHRMPGRTRVAMAGPLPPLEALQSLAAALTEVDGVDHVEIRPQSGSIVIRHSRGYDDIAAGLTSAGLRIESAPPAAPAADPIQETVDRLVQADAVLKRLSGGKADMWSLAFYTLVLGGFVQLGRGRVAGPAFTLFGQAASLAMSRPLRKFLG